MRRESGRVHILTVLGGATAVAILALFFSGGESPTTVASRFMSALAKQDANEIVKCSFIGEKSEAEAREAWKKTFDYTKYFAFEWGITGSSQPDDKNAIVKLQVKGNADNPASYEEKFDIALRRVNNSWKVDVRAISKDMFPALPR